MFERRGRNHATNTAQCTSPSTGAGAVAGTPDTDPESPTFQLNRVDVIYTVTPPIPIPVAIFPPDLSSHGGDEGNPVMPSSGRPRPGHEEGQASFEMVVSLMVVMSLMFWLFELSMFTYTCSVLNDAAQEGVRYATMHGTDSSVCSGPDLRAQTRPLIPMCRP